MNWTILCFVVLYICVARGGSVSPTDDLGAKIAAATAGELFTLSAGTYEISSTIQIPNSIIIQGVGSRSVIQCTSKFIAFLAANYNFELRQVTLQNCGTVIYMTNGTLALCDASLLSNVNDTNGGPGAITITNSPSVLVIGTTFANNGGGYGGAMSIYNAQNITIKDSVFSSNSADYACGSVYISGGHFQITNSTFQQNRANQDNGGAVCAASTAGSFLGCTIQDNYGAAYGGGIVVQKSSITIIDSSMSHNNGYLGGAIFIDSQANASLDNVLCHDNRATVDGGCILSNPNATTIVRNSNISRNSAENAGGGLRVSGFCFVYNCTIFRNAAAWRGGGIMSDSQTDVLEIDLSVITDNVSPSGGGIFMDQIKSGLLAYDTMADNQPDDFYFVPAKTDTSMTTVQMIHMEVYRSESNQTLCCGNSSYQTPYPGYQLCSYPICENCINGCNCPDPMQKINGESPAYASINTTCSFEHCDAETAGSCDVNAFCIEFPDRITHNCTCKSGFYGNGTFCQEIRSCANNTCSPFASCTNLTNTYECSCDYGYYGDGYQCEEIRSCTNNTCSPFATCTNLTDTYNCSCNFGYRGNGYQCDEIDYCAEIPCGGNATCTNSIGHYNCSCDKGFRGDGYNCSEIRFCDLNPCSPFATCTDSLNSYHCSCTSGFSGDGFNCTDINECANNATNNCSQFAFCQNTLGSFSCSCMPDYTGDGLICASIPDIVPQVPKQHRNKGAIIGGVIGGLAAVALLVGIVLLIIYRCKPRRESIPSFEIKGGKQRGKFGLESLGSGYSSKNLQDNPSSANDHL
eukprot:Phypoly_transcript_02419.p1 GENE.Phypoly_transcript_02419~~Phypoly_transcript_02419.p1  ORF type:complete len:803 (+),score=42.26 Phypoly_transcript_02419:412-2820(+)